jgi:hypothetical protein
VYLEEIGCKGLSTVSESAYMSVREDTHHVEIGEQVRFYINSSVS